MDVLGPLNPDGGIPELCAPSREHIFGKTSHFDLAYFWSCVASVGLTVGTFIQIWRQVTSSQSATPDLSSSEYFHQNYSNFSLASQLLLCVCAGKQVAITGNCVRVCVCVTDAADLVSSLMINFALMRLVQSFSMISVSSKLKR